MRALAIVEVSDEEVLLCKEWGVLVLTEEDPDYLRVSNLLHRDAEREEKC
jgi:hypothetical protein